MESGEISNTEQLYPCRGICLWHHGDAGFSELKKVVKVRLGPDILGVKIIFHSLGKAANVILRMDAVCHWRCVSLCLSMVQMSSQSNDHAHYVLTSLLHAELPRVLVILRRTFSDL